MLDTRKSNLLYLVGTISFFALLIFLFALIFFSKIESGIVHLIRVYGYLAAFLITFIVDLLPQPLGPEIALISGRIIGLNPPRIALVTILGSTLASIVNYKVGRLFYPLVYKKEKSAKYIKLYKKYSKYALLVSALGPIPYVPFCWFSGAFGLSRRNFFFFGIFPRIIRIIFVSSMLLFLNISII